MSYNLLKLMALIIWWIKKRGFKSKFIKINKLNFIKNMYKLPVIFIIKWKKS